ARDRTTPSAHRPSRAPRPFRIIRGIPFGEESNEAHRSDTASEPDPTKSPRPTKAETLAALKFERGQRTACAIEKRPDLGRTQDQGRSESVPKRRKLGGISPP